MKRIRILSCVLLRLSQVPVSVAAISLCLIFSQEVLGRVGGGQSYGRGGGHGGGGGGGGAIIWLIFQLIRLLLYLTFEYPLIGIPLDLLVIGSVVYFFSTRGKTSSVSFSSSTAAPASPGYVDNFESSRESFNREFEQLRKFDPNFSEIVFTDFCYALYGKVHDGRGRGREALDLFSPYLSDAARNDLAQRNVPGLQEVKGIIVGAMPILNVQGLETPTVRINVMFEANYTEVLKNNGASEMTYYVRERWDFERKRDVLSPAPAQATALHCPRCGAPLQKETVGACVF